MPDDSRLLQLRLRRDRGRISLGEVVGGGSTLAQ